MKNEDVDFRPPADGDGSPGPFGKRSIWRKLEAAHNGDRHARDSKFAWVSRELSNGSRRAYRRRLAELLRWTRRNPKTAHAELERMLRVVPRGPLVPRGETWTEQGRAHLELCAVHRVDLARLLRTAAALKLREQLTAAGSGSLLPNGDEGEAWIGLVGAFKNETGGEGSGDGSGGDGWIGDGRIANGGIANGREPRGWSTWRASAWRCVLSCLMSGYRPEEVDLLVRLLSPAASGGQGPQSRDLIEASLLLHGTLAGQRLLGYACLLSGQERAAWRSFRDAAAGALDARERELAALALARLHEHCGSSRLALEAAMAAARTAGCGPASLVEALTHAARAGRGSEALELAERLDALALESPDSARRVARCVDRRLQWRRRSSVAAARDGGSHGSPRSEGTPSLRAVLIALLVRPKPSANSSSLDVEPRPSVRLIRGLLGSTPAPRPIRRRDSGSSGRCAS